MEIGICGLGRMGMGIVKRLLAGGHRVVAYNRSEPSIVAAEAAGAEGARTLDEVVAKLHAPRVVWMMVPEGAATEAMLLALAERLSPGDIIIDGGNSWYKDTLRRAALPALGGIGYVDCGTSGGIWGETEGFALMVGGDKADVARLTPIFQTLAPAPDHGWGHMGPHGSGHFVKMVHNGIEYGMMQAYAEGFDLLRAKEEFALDLAQVSELWRYGSVVRSWLLDLTAAALAEDSSLRDIAPYVEDNGEGRWTAIEGVELGIPLPVITLALQRRFLSRSELSYDARVLAAMRKGFGGHAIKAEGKGHKTEG